MKATLVALALALASCSPADTTESGSQADLQATPFAASATYDYVFASVTIDADDTTPAAGFNIDGLYSVATNTNGCLIADRASDLDVDQNQSGCSPGANCVGGVDNVLPQVSTLVRNATRTDLRNHAQVAITGGQMFWILRLTGVDSLVNDTAVQATLFSAWSTDPTCDPFHNGVGSFVVNNASLVTPGNLSTPRWTTSGRITGGRLIAFFGTHTTTFAEGGVDVSVPTATGSTKITVYQTHIRAQLDSTGKGATLGNLGGWVDLSALTSLLSTGLPTASGPIRGLLGHAADLDETGTCPTSGTPKTPAVGLGVRFTLQRGAIVGTASSAPTGVCGASS